MGDRSESENQRGDTFDEKNCPKEALRLCEGNNRRGRGLSEPIAAYRFGLPEIWLLPLSVTAEVEGLLSRFIVAFPESLNPSWVASAHTIPGNVPCRKPELGKSERPRRSDRV